MYKYLNSPLVKFFLGLAELLLIVGFIFKSLNAGLEAPFIKGLYTVTDALSAPFNDVFVDKALNNGGIFDMAIFTGIVVYTIIVIVPILLFTKYKKDRPKE